MLSKTVKKLLKARRSKKVVNPGKRYDEFKRLRLSQQIRHTLREIEVNNLLYEINQIVNDRSFRFVLWDYGNFYSVQVFEGKEECVEDCVILGQVDTNYAKHDNVYIQIPYTRKTFRNLQSVKAYILWYHNSVIVPENTRALKFAMEIVYDIKTTQIGDVKFGENKAVVFTVDMMREWQKTGLLPKISQLYNGKRYNRTNHQKKVIAALKQNRIIQQDDTYIVYWG